MGNVVRFVALAMDLCLLLLRQLNPLFLVNGFLAVVRQTGLTTLKVYEMK